MKFPSAKLFFNLLAVLLILGAGYYYREEAGFILRRALNQLQPCQSPITYSVAEFDPRFNLTEEELSRYLKRAEEIWELPVNEKLFEHSLGGDLKINFIYDYRQKATDELKKMGIVINDDRSTYDMLKAKYDLLIASYNEEKSKLGKLVSAYDADKSVFDKEVDYWNSRGGAPKSQYNILEQKRASLNNQVAIINQSQNSLNAMVETINSTELVLNKLVNELNLQVNEYNEIGLSTGKQFNEGEYVRNASGTAINVFQFKDANQLVRILAHEFGHALGLDHIDNPKAIMYYLNEGVNEKLTADDLAALKKVCGIK